MRIAVAGDVHFGKDSRGRLRPHLEEVDVDALLLAGDLTRRGEPAEAGVLAEELRGLPVPVLAVLGNHDYHCGAQDTVAEVLTAAGLTILEGSTTTLSCGGASLAVAGVKGFGGGFAGACATEFGEPEMKEFVASTRRSAERLRTALRAAPARATHVVALLHYAPVEQTLAGERPALWPFLGSYLLGEAVDAAGADVVFHGHAHGGSPRGVTPSGIDVYNVAQPVLGGPLMVFDLVAHAPDLGEAERRRRVS